MIALETRLVGNLVLPYFPQSLAYVKSPFGEQIIGYCCQFCIPKFATTVHSTLTHYADWGMNGLRAALWRPFGCRWVKYSTMSQQSVLAAQKANCFLDFIKRNPAAG